MAKQKHRAGGGTPATVALTRAGVEFTLRNYVHDPAETDFGGEAARELGVEPERVFKTLLVDIDGALTVAVVPVTGLLDLKALAAVRGGKRAQLADPAVAEKKTGYVVGGISPIGQKYQSPTVIDESARHHSTVFVSGGRRGCDIELAADELIRVTRGEWARIAKQG